MGKTGLTSFVAALLSSALCFTVLVTNTTAQGTYTGYKCLTNLQCGNGNCIYDPALGKGICCNGGPAGGANLCRLFPGVNCTIPEDPTFAACTDCYNNCPANPANGCGRPSPFLGNVNV